MTRDSSTAMLDTGAPTEEETQVHSWRVQRLAEVLGLDVDCAELIAERVDWHEASALVAAGCSPRVALEILL